MVIALGEVDFVPGLGRYTSACVHAIFGKPLIETDLSWYSKT